MIINQILLKNYRNYNELKIKFNKNINIIIGDNAQGKTNILESIYFLSITKSYRTSDDINLINYGKEFLKVNAKIKDEDIPKTLEINLNRKGKILNLNNNTIKKVSEFIGLLSVIMMCPEDVEIIKGSPSERRNLLNIELSKLSQNYINKYNEYNKLLKMRNDYLKLLMTNGISDYRYFDILTDKLIEKACYIYIERKRLIDDINKHITQIYEDITGIKGLIIRYCPNIDIKDFCEESLKKTLKSQYLKNQNKEIVLGMTLYGPHRDDFSFHIEEQNLKIFGSQGQQKLAIISLKLALVKISEFRTKKMPVLLLDDIFSEIDKKKKNKIISYINNCGQVIITTNDIRDINKNKLKQTKIFEIKDKKITEKGDINGKFK